MKRVLLDTDVLLDFFYDRQPFSDDAAQIIGFCEQKKIKAFITPVIISNLYYLLRKNASHKKVIDSLQALLTVVDVLNVDGETVHKALNSKFKDFEDALQNYASLNKVDIIITRNIKDYKYSELAVFSPSDFVKIV